MPEIIESENEQDRLIKGVSYPVDMSKCVISSPYYEKRGSGYHKGIDFAPFSKILNIGYKYPVYAVCNGEIYKQGWQNPKDHKEGFGLRLRQVIEIDGKKFDIFYGHLFQLITNNIIDELKHGDIIGIMGETGHCYSKYSNKAIHLHLEIREHLTKNCYGIQFV